MNQVNSERPLAVITGASSGIGFELAREFAEHGFDILAAADGPAINDLRVTLSHLGVSVDTMQVDLANYAGVENLVERIESMNRPVEALAINAGIGVSGDFARSTSLDQEMRLIQLNVMSAVHLCKRVVRDMVARNRGHILFTSSIAATAPGPYFAVYAASKAFIQSFAEGIRYELKETGVSVTSLMPGATETNFFARADMLDTKVAQEKKDSASVVAREGYEALMANKDHVIAGAMKNSVQAFMSKFLPETVRASMQAKQTKPGSAYSN